MVSAADPVLPSKAEESFLLSILLTEAVTSVPSESTPLMVRLSKPDFTEASEPVMNIYSSAAVTASVYTT